MLVGDAGECGLENDCMLLAFYEEEIGALLSAATAFASACRSGEKEQFVKFMRLYERFYGLRVVTFCIMGNHFHILVEVPKRPETLPPDEALIGLVA